MPNIGPLELAVVLVIALIIFGPKRLPELGRSLGRGIREFRGSVTDDTHYDEDERRSKQDEIESPIGSAEHVEGETVEEKRA